MSGSDRLARERIGTDLDTTFVVEASAGTGKTTALVGRILALLQRGVAELSGIVAVTFTDKAAGEMKLRLLAEIDRTRAAPETGDKERGRLSEALEQLERANIGTIHGFCANLLRERPIEAGVDPDFDVIDEDGAEELLLRAIDSWFEEALEDPSPTLRRFFRRRPSRTSPRDSLLSMCEKLSSCRDHATPWRRPPFDIEDEANLVFEEVESLGALAVEALDPRDYLARALREMADFARKTRESERRPGPRDYERLEAELAELLKKEIWKRKGRTKYFADGILRADVLGRRAELHERLTAFIQAADADLAAALFMELQPVLAGYEDLKRRRGALDFLDLLVATRDLIRGDQAIRAQLQGRFSHIFVDEFQDTDPLQTEIVFLLAADDPACADAFATRPVPGKLFVVGDPKQAIYRFRRADVVIYKRAREHLLSVGADALVLSTSYRSVPNIQAAINAGFAPEMGDGSAVQASYVPLEPARPAHDGQPSLVALPIPAPYSDHGNVIQKAIQSSLPDALAAFVKWMIEASGWTVDDALAGARVPVRSQHICLLFRGMVSWGKDLTRPYVRALEARRIPHVLVGGRSFHDREEVMALRAALTAIEWPADELNVYATLRGPFLAIDDATLFHFREGVGRLNPLRPLDDDTRAAHPAVASALDLLAGLHRRRNRAPVADTISAFLTATRAQASVAIWPTGEQSLANLLRVLEQARSFEKRGATSFRSFVEWLHDRSERGEDAQAPIVEEGSEGIRIMTVHKAKGLEFPVVILCDPGRSRLSSRPSRYVDSASELWAFPLAGFVPHELRDHETEITTADEAEEVRVAYVAATRARDLLVVPVVGDDARAGWVDVLHRSLYPAPADKRTAQPVPGCPDFGDDSVLDRPMRADKTSDDSVHPGLHTIGGVDAAWWDPAILDLDAPSVGGIRQQDLLIEDDTTNSAKQSIEAFARWKATHEAVIARGSVAARPSTSTTSLSHHLADAIPPSPFRAAIEKTRASGSSRPIGARFGTLVHAVLADIPFDADAPTIESYVGLHSRLLGAPAAETTAAADAVALALTHPLILRAARATACHRELPLHRVLDDGTVLEGIADLVFFDAGTWTVVDYKTDPTVDQPHYHIQVDLYAQTLAALFDAPTAAILFGV